MMASSLLSSISLCDLAKASLDELNAGEISAPKQGLQFLQPKPSIEVL